MSETPRSQTTPLDDVLALPSEAVAAVCAPSHQVDLTGADVVEVAELLGIDFAAAPFTIEDLQLGMEMELELGADCTPSMSDAIDDDLVELGMVAAANLQEQPDFYIRLSQAHAPGDPAPAHHHHPEVGTD